MRLNKMLADEGSALARALFRTLHATLLFEHRPAVEVPARPELGVLDVKAADPLMAVRRAGNGLEIRPAP